MKSRVACNIFPVLFVLTIVGGVDAYLAAAATPPIPRDTSGSGDGGMKHALVRQTGTALSIHIPEPPAAPVTMMAGHGQDYTPDKFNVLEDVYFNAQYGWLPDGFFNLPGDRSVWLQRLGATQPAGSTFKVFEGGNGMEGMAVWTMAEIYIEDGNSWKWDDGAMQHDYFTADRQGDYSMMFRVYVGDSTGAEDTTYTPATTTFEFRVVPEPAAMMLASLGLLCCAGWRW